MTKHYLLNRCLRWCCFTAIILSSATLVSAQDHLYADAKKAVRQAREQQRSLREVLQEIQTHFKISFIYESGVLEGKALSGDVDYKKNVESTLVDVLAPMGLKFKKINKHTYSILPTVFSLPVQSRSSDSSDSGVSTFESPVEEFRSDETVNFTSQVSPDILVNGTVADNQSNPIPGANVLIKGTTIGTTTDADGKFSISVPDANSVLVVSFIGYVSKEVTVGAQTEINITLEADVKQLSEVVVVGYGTQKRGAVTGAVSSVNAREIAALPVPSVSAALQGRVAGVLVTNNGGPGSSAIVRIRGIGSITQDSDPLYVVDGFPAPNFNLNSIDTKDIESVEILKDAAATAVYGSRAANGVVLITTKSGSKDQRVHVDIEAYTGTQSAWKKLDLLNREQYLAYGTALATNAGGLPPTRFSNMNSPIYAGTTQTFAQTETDWQDEMFRAAPISQLQGSVAGSTEKSKMYLSFGRFKQDGIMLGTSFDRYNARLGVETKISKRFTVGENVQVTQSNNYNQLESGGRTMIMHMLRSVPYSTVYNPNANGGFNGTTSEDGSDPENPVRLSLMDKRVNHNVYILSNTFLQANIFDGLSYKFTFGVNYSANRFVQNDPIFDTGWPVGGYQARTTHDLADNRSHYYSLYYSNLLSYDKKFGDHTINAILVGERQDEKTNSLNTFGRLSTNDINVLTGAPQETLTVNANLDERYLLSYLGRVNYDYQEKYLLSVSMRRDGFSGFAPGHKWGNFPGASIGWKISEETFMSTVTQISDLKLRASYGKVGAKPNQPYAWVSPVFTNALYPFSGGGASGSYFQKLPNKEFAWEISEMKNIGLDLGMMNDQFTLSAEYFVKDTDGLILTRQPAWSLGLDQGTDQNIGQMRNSGWEFTAGYAKIGNNFTLNLSGNVSFIKNEVNALYDDVVIFAGTNQDYGNGNFTRTIAGSSIQHFYLEEVDGIFQSMSEIIDSEGRPTQDNLILPLLPDGTVDLSSTTEAGYNNPINLNKYTRPGDIRFKEGGPKDMGSFLPKFTYGFNASATFKGLDFTMFIQGVQGNKIYNGTRVITEGMQRLFNSGTAVMNAWTPANTNTDVPRAVGGDPNGNARPSDRFLEDGSYLRIKNLSIGYTLPTSLFDFTGGAIKKFRVYISSQNLLTVTKYSGYDPEVGNRNADNINDNPNDANRFLTNGVDYGQFPQARTFIGGVQIGF